MKLSTRGRYGLRALFQLALMQDSQPVPLKVIASEQGISEPYLEQLIAPLREAELVESVRGAHGGYSLAQEPGEVTVGDILRVLEGPIAPHDCAAGESPEDSCMQGPQCVIRHLWIQIRDSIASVVDDVTLADMVEREQKLREDQHDETAHQF